MGPGRRPSQPDEDETVNQAPRCGRGRRARSARGAVPGVLQAHLGHDFDAPLAAPAQQGRGQAGVHAAAVHPAPGALRPVGPRSPRHGVKLLRPARVHHGRRRAADAGLPALRPRCDRLHRPAAERLARDAAKQPGGRQHPVERDQEGAPAARGPGRAASKDKYATFWAEFGAVLKEGVAEDYANRDDIAALLRFASTHRRSHDPDRLARPTMSRG